MPNNHFEERMNELAAKCFIDATLNQTEGFIKEIEELLSSTVGFCKRMVFMKKLEKEASSELPLCKILSCGECVLLVKNGIVETYRNNNSLAKIILGLPHRVASLDNLRDALFDTPRDERAKCWEK